MSLNWDYSSFARTYEKRPGYAERVLDRIHALAGLDVGACVVDIGAGTGLLTRSLLKRSYRVVAVEPNAEMRAIGMRNTGDRAKWLDSVGEQTGLAAGSARVVFFGSSFNVVDQQRALRESARILIPGGRFVCLWNHRQLDDPLQAQVEALIHRMLPGFRYGSRREDQRPVILESGLFGEPEKIEDGFIHTFTLSDYLDAWRSHATLARQAGATMELIIESIAELLSGRASLDVPYTTRAWCAPRLDVRPG